MIDNPVFPISKVIRIFSDHIDPKSFVSENELRDFIKNNNYEQVLISPDNFYECYQRIGWPNKQGNIIILDPAGNVINFYNFQLP